MQAFATLGARAARAALSDPRLVNSSNGGCGLGALGSLGAGGCGGMGLGGCVRAGASADGIGEEVEARMPVSNRAGTECFGHALPLLESCDASSGLSSSCAVSLSSISTDEPRSLDRFSPSPNPWTLPRGTGIVEPGANLGLHSLLEKRTGPQAGALAFSASPTSLHSTQDAAGCSAWGRVGEESEAASNGCNGASSGASFVYLDVTRESGPEAKTPSMLSACDVLAESSGDRGSA